MFLDCFSLFLTLVSTNFSIVKRSSVKATLTVIFLKNTFKALTSLLICILLLDYKKFYHTDLGKIAKLIIFEKAEAIKIAKLITISCMC